MVGTQRMDDNFVVTLFWSRLRDMSPADQVEYRERELELRRAAERIDGFVGVKSYTGDDGERLSVVIFDSEDAQRQWREHPGHAAAQRAGRQRFYSEYQIVIARTVRHRRWIEADAESTAAPVEAANVVRLPARR